MKSCAFRPQPLKFLPKKFLIFLPKKTHCERFSNIFSKESFSYIFSNETLHFLPQARKIKNIHPRKIFYTSGNKNPEKSSCSFYKESFSCISGNRNPEKIFIF